MPQFETHLSEHIYPFHDDIYLTELSISLFSWSINICSLGDGVNYPIKYLDEDTEALLGEGLLEFEPEIFQNDSSSVEF